MTVVDGYTIRESRDPLDAGIWHVYDAAGEWVNSFVSEAVAVAHVKRWAGQEAP